MKKLDDDILEQIPFLMKLIDDFRKNKDQYELNGLRKDIVSFQKNVIAKRSSSQTILASLSSLSTREIKGILEKLDIRQLYLISGEKKKIVMIAAGLIELHGKAPKFNQLAASLSEKKSETRTSELKASKSIARSRKALSKKKRRITGTADELEKIRDKWLLTEESELKKELDDIHLSDIRKIVKPWNLHYSSNSRKVVIDTILKYVTKMHRFSRLGS
ncbi:MAG: hypothetical protein ACTSVI_05995 [Promethearchaeota archaeon]